MQSSGVNSLLGALPRADWVCEAKELGPPAGRCPSPHREERGGRGPPPASGTVRAGMAVMPHQWTLGRSSTKTEASG